MTLSRTSRREKLRNYIFETKTVNGSRARVAFIALARLLKKTFPRQRAIFDKLLEACSGRKLIIRNTIGTFRIRPTDDSLAKAMPHFEKKCHGWLKGDRRKLFIDIGANSGFYTILAARTCGYDAVVSFEPNPAVYELLEENVILNNLQHRVKCFRLAVGEKSQRLPFRRYMSHTGLSGFIESESDTEAKNHEQHEVVEIETWAFDELAEKLHINVVDIAYIKIDVEGFEYSVLRGMRRTLSEIGNVKLMIEISEKSRLREQTMSLMKELGFSMQDKIGINYLFAKGAVCSAAGVIGNSSQEGLESVPAPIPT